MGLMQTNGGVHMGTNTIAIATTQCEQALIHVWNQQIVKGLCNFGNELLHYLELKK